VSDKPILFSSPMIKALISGRKFQTRRIITRLGRPFGAITEFGPSTTRGYDWHFRDRRGRWNDVLHDRLLGALPYAVGDRIWVREAIQFYNDTFNTKHHYAADDAPLRWSNREQAAWLCSYKRDKAPGIHMPRWASRLTLTVTDVRVQRLQEISEEDAIAEGVCQFVEENDKVPWSGLSDTDRQGIVRVTYGSAVKAYSHLWETINGADSWALNPFVTAYAFTVERRNIANEGEG
jgi:hypothetical protein